MTTLVHPDRGRALGLERDGSMGWGRRAQRTMVRRGLDISRDVAIGSCVVLVRRVAEAVAGCAGLMARKAASGQGVWIVVLDGGAGGADEELERVRWCLEPLGIGPEAVQGPSSFGRMCRLPAGGGRAHGDPGGALAAAIVGRRPAQVLAPAGRWPHLQSDGLDAALASALPATARYRYLPGPWPWAAGPARDGRRGLARWRREGPVAAGREIDPLTALRRLPVGLVDVEPVLLLKRQAYVRALRAEGLAETVASSLSALLAAPESRTEVLLRPSATP